MDYIEINGYKSIKNQKVLIEPINIFIGANGSGKSNFVSFFDFLNNIYNRKLNDVVAMSGGPDKILHHGMKVTNRISFMIQFDNGVNGYSARLNIGADGFIFVDERLHYNGDSGRDISRSASESRLKVTDNFRSPHVIRYLNGFKKYHFHDTSNNSPFTKLSHIENDVNFLYRDGHNLAAFLFDIRKKNQLVYNKIVKTIQSIAPYFSDFYLEPSDQYVRLQWTDKFSEVTYGATDLSDGTIRFIALTTLFFQPNLPDTIIIDEPELGLHPAAIAKLAGMIKSVAKKRCQVIIATQSTDLISHFGPNDIVTVDQIEGNSVFNRLKEEDLASWLNDYTIDDLWKRNLIEGGQPNP
nr:AAA family ATPase [uncultured Fluviicola sp.]